MYVIAERTGRVVGSTISRDNRDGEYWRGDRWTPAEDEAKEFDTVEKANAEAEANCNARTWIIMELPA